ncbi:MAG: FMN-binding negative transcriptional regulator [Actinomycetaceae bacterium]|nr:FMN-binding negative transcriptional regulator [Actinomycetaceae bacterium]
MLSNPYFCTKDQQTAMALIENNPWVTMVSSTSQGLVASHYAVLVEETSQEVGFSLVGHVGKPDDKILQLKDGSELLVIAQGPHGYISPSWYGDGSHIPTWNHVTGHFWYRVEILSQEENFEFLVAMVDHFEKARENPCDLRKEGEQAVDYAKGTVGIRLHIERFELREKLNQNRPFHHVSGVIENLPESGNPQLGAYMKRYYHKD